MSQKNKVCNLDIDVNINKSATTLSQSEHAFNARYHTGKVAFGGGKCTCNNCTCGCGDEGWCDGCRYHGCKKPALEKILAAIEDGTYVPDIKRGKCTCDNCECGCGDGSCAGCSVHGCKKEKLKQKLAKKFGNKSGGGKCSCDNCPCKCDKNGCKCTGDYKCDCGCQMNGGGYYLDVGANRVGGLPEVVPVFDSLAPKYSPKGAGQYPKPAFLDNQKGGAYNFIVNPKTGRRVKLNGKIGKRVLRNYLFAQNGGDLSIFDPNMQNREFGCKQPEWSPNCV